MTTIRKETEDLSLTYRINAHVEGTENLKPGQRRVESFGAAVFKATDYISKEFSRRSDNDRKPRSNRFIPDSRTPSQKVIDYGFGIANTAFNFSDRASSYLKRD
ncbi:hypothetical protein HOI26_05025 [Candidatus Woesearchaeota archaeon]|nr:hypothetical protein [Candidatus Woesearchaeota archaeon]MBT5740431.1 hypothetical protein [Candidatus Woesearchaeota archaeon]